MSSWKKGKRGPNPTDVAERRWSTRYMALGISRWDYWWPVNPRPPAHSPRQAPRSGPAVLRVAREPAHCKLSRGSWGRRPRR